MIFVPGREAASRERTIGPPVRFRIGVEVEAHVEAVFEDDGEEAPFARLFDALMDDHETRERWVRSLVGWELATGGPEVLADELLARAPLSTAFPALAPSDRQYFDRFRAQHPYEASMNLDEYLERQRSLLNAVVADRRVLDAWRRHGAMFYTISDGAMAMWPEDVDREALLPLAWRLPEADRLQFAPSLDDPPDDTALLQMEKAVTVEFLSVGVDEDPLT
jgi:hypothetical protein